MGKCQRGEHVPADEFLIVRVPRQVELGVPLPEQRAIAFQKLDLRGRQFDVMLGQDGRKCVGRGIHRVVISLGRAGPGTAAGCFSR